MSKKGYLLFCIAALLAVMATGCRKTGASRPEFPAEPFRSEFVLGTICTITLYDQAESGVYQKIFSRLREIENRMSVNLPDSDISRVNRAAGIEPVRVHDDVLEVVETAIRYAKLSDGAFDPTVGPLVSLWGIGGENARVPKQEEIDRLLPLVNWRDLVLDKEKQTVFLTRPGMALDLGAIAKGYAADKAAAVLREAAVSRAMIDLGGNILTYGVKKDKSPWKVGIQDPFSSRGGYIGIVPVGEETVVTSGVYERFFIGPDGTHYHHLLSPRLGYPARSGLLSASVIAKTSMDADALSTAIFVLGWERGKALLDSLGIKGVFVFEDMSIHLAGNPGFSLTDTAYRLVKD